MRGLLWLLKWCLVGGTATAIACVLATVIWLMTPNTLPSTLSWAASQLNSTESDPPLLTVEGAQGDLRTGGRIESLVWVQTDLRIELHGLQWRWPADMWLKALWQGELVVNTLSLERIAIDDQRPTRPPEPPPSSLAWPWLNRVQVPVRINELHVNGTTPMSILGVEGVYRYSKESTRTHSGLHQVELTQLRWADGRYQGQASLESEGAMRLSAQMRGHIDVSAATVRDLSLSAQLEASGSLAGEEGYVEVNALVEPSGAGNHSTLLKAQARLLPWKTQVLDSGKLDLQNVDLATVWPQAPRTLLSGFAQATPRRVADADQWTIDMALSNRLSGPWDRGLLPVDSLDTQWELDSKTWQLKRLEAKLAGGTLSAKGTIKSCETASGDECKTQAWQPESLELRARSVDPSKILSTWRWSALDVTLKAQRKSAGPNGSSDFQWSVTPTSQDPSRTATLTTQGSGRWSPRWIEWLGARLQLQGLSLESDGRWDRQQGTWQGQGQARAPGLTASVSGRSSLGWPLTGQGQAQLDMPDAQSLTKWLEQLIETLPIGAGSSMRGLLREVNGLNMRGGLSATAQWGGETGDGTGGFGLRLQMPRMTFARPGDAPIAQRTIEFKDWTSTLTENPQDIAWRHTGQVLAAEGRLDLTLNAHGPTQWLKGRGQELWIDQLALDVTGPRPDLSAKAQLKAPLRLRREQGAWIADAGTLSVLPATTKPAPMGAFSREAMTIQWSASTWSEDLLTTRGRVDALAMSWINALLQSDTAPSGPLAEAGLRGEVLWGAEWDVYLPLKPAKGQSPALVRFEASHQRGDVVLLNPQGSAGDRIDAGLKQAKMSVVLKGDALNASLVWNSAQAGQMSAQLNTRLQQPSANQGGWSWPLQAPVGGQLQLDLPQIGLWSRLAPPGWRLRGRFRADAQLAGTREQPLWRGTVQGSQLALRSLADGIDFSDGSVNATLDGDTLTIESLRLRGAGGASGGWLTGQGQARWTRPASPTGGALQPHEGIIDLTLKAERLHLLARADRRLTLSGDIQTHMQGNRLGVEGRLEVDQAHFILPDESTPVLGDDVVVRNGLNKAAPKPRSALELQVQLQLLLGKQFRLQGQGIDTHLEGRLRLDIQPQAPSPRVTGQVKTVRGSYKAYGQTLSIDEGQLVFNGPYDNPTLDILAVRPHPTQKVGVEIKGTAKAPRAQLYAEPDLPDNEKLAWLLLGRPASGTGAEAAVLQQAAMALLTRGQSGEGIGSRLGLDELSVRGESTNTDGSTNAAALTLGKRISDQLYVTYTRSVIGVMGTVAVLYDISRYLTLRAQAGDDNALELIYTHKFDGQTLPAPTPRSGPGRRPDAATIQPVSP